MKNLNHILLLCCILVASCNRNPKLDYALSRAGDNRAELEKVLEHYQDSGLKYEAARFLIENMPASFGADSADCNGYAPSMPSIMPSAASTDLNTLGSGANGWTAFAKRKHTGSGNPRQWKIYKACLPNT